MTKRQTTIISAIIIVVIALCFMVSKRLWFRIDLTKGKLYTISQVSRNLHKDIPDQVRITYYLSDKLKAIHPMPGEIEDLLREYVSYSRGKIQLSIIDPAKANITAQIEQIGILPQQIQTVEQDQASIMTVYTGILIEYLDEEPAKIPVVFSLETLEYDLTSRIRSLVRGSPRTLGVIPGNNPNRFNEDYRTLQGTFYQADYQIRIIPPGQEIPDSISALLVLGGVENFDEAALYHIDRYIQMGGKALFTVKSVHIEIESGLNARKLTDNGLLGMLSFYGVTVQPEIVMDRSALMMQYQTSSQPGITQYRITRNPQWVRILGDNGNPAHPASSQFSGLDLYWANPLLLHAPENIEAEYLFTTTPDAWLMREPFSTNPDIPYLLERDAPQTRGSHIIGASLTGIFPSWFDGMPKPESAEEMELPDMPLEAQPARIIVIGETEFITSFLGATNGYSNFDFLLRAAGWLSNDDDIIGIRSREASSGRLDKIIDDQKRSSAMRLGQLINVYMVPLLVIVAGIFFALRRRLKARSNAEIEKELQNDL